MTDTRTTSEKPGRYAIRITNHATGEQWSIHDSHDVCMSERSRVLKEWGSDNCAVDGPVELDQD
jgi:hypothetical protein